jgi:DNA repair exonuclease SbcCD ATPase subunit
MKRAAVAVVAVGALVMLFGVFPQQMALGDSEIAMGDLVALADQIGVPREEGERHTLAGILQHIVANHKELEATVAALGKQLAAAEKSLAEVRETATSALSKANSAASSATKAQQTADQALTRANSASTAASSAQQTATSALTKTQTLEKDLASLRTFTQTLNDDYVRWSWDHAGSNNRRFDEVWRDINRIWNQCCR